MKKAMCVFLMVSVILFSIGAAGQKEAAGQKAVVIRAGHVNPPGEPAYEAWNFFKKIMDDKLGSRVDVQIFPQSQLGNERDLIEQVKLNSIEMTAPAVSPLALHNPELNVLNLPYLFKDENALWKVVDGAVGKRLIESTKKSAGVLIMNWWSTGVRHIFASKPIKSVAEMKDVKIRVMENPVFIDSFRALNSQPTPMPYGEVYQALATRIVDAAENDSSGYRNMKFFEVAPYYNLTAHLIITKPVLINPGFYENLPADIRKVLDDAITESTKFQRKLFEENFAKDIKWLKEQKVTVIELNTAEFQRLMLPVWSKYEQNIGPGLLNDVKKVLGIQ